MPRLAMRPAYRWLGNKSAGYVRKLPLASLFVMCEQMGMTKPTISDLMSAANISRSYACEILGTARKPSRSLAIHILQTTGWRHSVLDDLSDEQIAVLASIEPWTRKATQGEAA